MKIRVDNQIKLSMALLVLIGTQFTLAEITGKKVHGCQAVLGIEFTESRNSRQLHFTNQSNAGWQVKSISVTLENDSGELIPDDLSDITSTAALQSIVLSPNDNHILELSFFDFPPEASYLLPIATIDRSLQSYSTYTQQTTIEAYGKYLTVEFTSPEGKSFKDHTTITLNSSVTAACSRVPAPTLALFHQ